MQFLYVCLGGAIGTGARYAVLTWTQWQFGHALPIGTFMVNALGSFLIGFITSIALDTETISLDMRAVLTLGLCGGFTTYSAFSMDTVAYLQNGEFIKALVNTFLMLLACIIFCAGGIFLAKWHPGVF